MITDTSTFSPPFTRCYRKVPLDTTVDEKIRRSREFRTGFFVLFASSINFVQAKLLSAAIGSASGRSLVYKDTIPQVKRMGCIAKDKMRISLTFSLRKIVDE